MRLAVGLKQAITACKELVVAPEGTEASAAQWVRLCIGFWFMKLPWGRCSFKFFRFVAVNKTYSTH